MDYYSYKPLVRLERPVLLTGLPGTEVVGIARMMGSFTGVPALLAERKLSHVLSYHPDRMTAEGRHSDRWALEKRMLAAALAATPMFVGLPPWSLLRVGAAGWLVDQGELVYLREPIGKVIDRVVRDVGEAPTRHWLLHDGRELDRARLERELAAYDTLLVGCARVVEVSRSESHAIATEVLDVLGLSPA